MERPPAVLARDGWLTFALVLLFGAEVFKGWNGLVQRVLLTLPLAWMIVLGIRLTRIAAADYRTAMAQAPTSLPT